MTQKVLITGASGFVGFHLIEAALAQGHEVYAAIRKSSSISHLQHLPIHFTYPNFGSIENLKAELEEKRYDYIIHAAGTTKAPTQEAYNNINADYTYNLVAAASQTDGFIKKIIFLSSLAAIGPLSDVTTTINELTPPVPVTAYGRSKLLAEQKIKAFDKIPVITLRPTAVYGPRDKDIFILFKALNRGVEPYIGKIDQQLSFVYVKDLARLCVNAIFAPVTKNEAYNITDGFSYNRYQLADLSKPLLYKKTFRFHLPLSAVKVLAYALEKTYAFLKKTPALNREKLNELTAVNWICDIQKAKTQLGYAPEYDLKSGLKETMEWYKQEKWL